MRKQASVEYSREIKAIKLVKLNKLFRTNLFRGAILVHRGVWQCIHVHMKLKPRSRLIGLKGC